MNEIWFSQIPSAAARSIAGDVAPRDAERPSRPTVTAAKSTSLRSNLTIRELAAVFAISKSQAHRIVANLVPRMAALLAHTVDADRRWSWIVDGTLIPTRDHACAAKSKNYRWSCNAQILVRRHDLRVVAVVAGGPGNRNDPVHYRDSSLEALCRAHRRGPTADTAGSASCEPPDFEDDASFATIAGDVTVLDAYVSSTQSRG